MSTHIRIKRRLRFLQEDDRIRVITDLEGETTLPAGAVFDHLLAAMGEGREEAALRSELARRMSTDPATVQALLDRLLQLAILERFEPVREPPDPFDRQLLLFDALDPVADHGVNIARQQRLRNAQVLVLGLGGIGHQVALSLAAAGLGSLVLVDADVVEVSNLHRQVLFAATDPGRAKVDAARDGILRIAPSCAVHVDRMMVRSAEDWRALIARYSEVRHVMLSADRPVQLVTWLSDARADGNYHFIKCGYMSAQGLIGPLLGPGSKGYEDLFDPWGNTIDGQPENIKALNDRAAAPTMAASNAIMANISALELIKHITGVGPLTLWEQRLLLDLRTYDIQPG
ncbi:MAG: ThiF family adenylyltransferase [Flavobacteriales bacterium]